MEYPQQAWLTFLVSVLAAYALSGWNINGWPTWCERTTGQGFVLQDGSYSYYEDKKPCNLGDPRAG